MMPQIILCITTVFFIVLSAYSVSAVLNGGPNAICQKKVSLRQPHDDYDPFQKRRNHDFLDDLKTGTTPETAYGIRWVTQKICCQGYKEENGTCTPRCSETCTNGYCAEPNVCKCNEYWGGNSCDEPLFCTIVQSVYANISATVSELPDPEHFKDATEKPLFERKGLPKCLSGCLDQVDGPAANDGQSGNAVHHLPINSPCNKIVAGSNFWKKYRTVIGAAIAVLSLTIIICVLCIVQRKRSLNDMANEHSDAEYAYVELRQLHDKKSPYAVCK